MRRFFISAEEIKAVDVFLKDAEFHHLKNVCRLEEGERVELLDGQGTLALAEIIHIEKKKAHLRVLQSRQLDPMPRPHIKIVLSLPKFQTVDVIIQKSVELGVNQIVPVLSDRSFVKKKSSDLTEKIHRWNKIGLEACKQSGRAWPLAIEQAQDLRSYLELNAIEGGLFLFEGESALNIKQALQKIPSSMKEITVFIGAEGGFSPEEVQLFQTKGLSPVTLGDLVLRVETACIAVTSIIKYHFDLMR